MVGEAIKAGVLVMVTAILLSSFSYSQVAATEDDRSGDVRLILPEKIYAASDVETNIFFDNVILTPNWRNYEFSVICDKGLLLTDRWTYTPREQENGEFPLVLEVRDASNRIVARARATVEVASASPKTTDAVTLLAVGDSITQAAVYTQHLLELAGRRNGPALTLIGSRGPDNNPAHGANRFEGYSGWTAEAFATFNGPLSRSGYFKPGETGSPFVFEVNKNRSLDFRKYCEQFNHSEAPDFVSFALGTNDVFAANDQNIETVIERVFLHYDSLIDMVHRFSRSTKVGVLLVIPPSEDQDGFRGYRPPERQTRWQYRRNQHRLVERMIQHYGRRERENIFLIPAYLNFDAAHNFVTRPMAWNAENPEQADRVIDGIHPASSGYGQMADTIYAWMRVMLSGANVGSR